jgi:hypothetical protein
MKLKIGSRNETKLRAMAEVCQEFSIPLCANMSETLRHCKISVGRGGNHQ